jgi:hypothetical protein
VTFGKNAEGLVVIELSFEESAAFLAGGKVVKHSEDKAGMFEVEVKLTRIINLSLAEKSVIRHSLLGSRDKGEPYRNRFVTNEGTRDFPVLEGLVKKGLMSRVGFPLDQVNTSFLYRVTEEGARAVKLKLPTT